MDEAPGAAVEATRMSDDSAAKPSAAAALSPPSPSLPSPSAAVDTTGTAPPPPQEPASPAASSSPSPRRRNRRKNARRSSNGGAEDDAMDGQATEETAATDAAIGELIVLPSPVAQASPSAVDVFAQDAAPASADVPEHEQGAIEQEAAADVITDPVADSSVATQEHATAQEPAEPSDDEQRDAQEPPSVPYSLPTPSDNDKAGDYDAAAVGPVESAAASEQEDPTEPVSAPTSPATASDNDTTDEIEVAEDLDEPVDGEMAYSEPGESPSPSPLPSPSRDEPASTEAGEPLLDVEAACNGDAPLDMNLQSAECLRLEASSPFSTSVNGPECSTAEDMPETPMSNLDSPVREDGYGSNSEPLSSRGQDPDSISSPPVGLESPGPAAPDENVDMSELQPGSPTQSDGAPLSVDAPASPETDLGSPPAAENGSMPSPPSKIAAPRSKNSTAASPPPAPTAAKKQTKPAVTRPTATRPTAASRLPVSKTSAVAKPTTKPTNVSTSKAVKPNSASTTARTENPKKAVPAKTATAKKSAPKAVVYNVSPAPRPKRTVPAQDKSQPANEAGPSSPTEPRSTDDADKTEVAGSDQDGSKVHPKRVSKAKSEAASNRLYEDAKAAKLRKEARSAEVDEACTFVPKVSHASAATTKRPSLGETDRFVALHEEAKQLQAKKQELQRKHEEATCTFRPTITSKAKKLARETARPRYENLYMQARELKQKREEKALARKKEDEEECSFRPKIKATKSPVQSKPLYDAEREKQKQMLLEQKRKEAEISECTFKPKVLSKKPSAKAEAGSATGEEGKIYDRLYRAGKVQAERIERLRKEREDEEKSKAPFQPQLVTSSSSHKAKEGDAQQKEPFRKRLYKKDHMQKISADREQQKLEEERRFSYKPKISEIPEEIKAKQKEYTSPDKPIFERLYEEKERIKEKLQVSEEMRAQKEMAECTFHPRVASSTLSSNDSAPTSPVWERQSICHKSQAIEEREKLKQQLEMQECTFKPVISPSDHVSPYRSPSYLARRRSSRSESCSPSFDSASRKASVKAPCSSPDSRSSLAQFQSVSIGNILKSSTLVLSEEKSPASGPNTTSPPASAPSSVTKSNSLYASDANGDNPSATLDSPRRPSPVHKPTEVQDNGGSGGKKSVADSDNAMSAPLPLARSLDAEFQEEEVAVLN